MIGFLAICAFISPQGPAKATLASDLHAADAAFYGVRPYPVDSDHDLVYAQTAYWEALHAYGHVPAARAGLARCLFYQGEYRLAETEFKLAGPPYAADSARASTYAVTANAIRRALHGTNVVEVAPVPESRLWAAVTGSPVKDQDRPGIVVSRVKLVLASISRTGAVQILGREPFRLTLQNGGVSNPPEEDQSNVDLYVMRRSRESRQWCAVVVRDYPGGDAEPTAVESADITPRGFRKARVFGSLAGIQVYPPDHGHGMLVVAAPTFKVWWTDVYEWRNGHFIFADARYPKFYSQDDYGWTDAESEYYYPMWMNRAAIYDIHRQWNKALYMWKRAERSCLKTIRTDNGRYDEPYHDVGFYGQVQINLREIRRRIRWLTRHQYNHPLLYRPYDFDVQVPPYRFGPARGVQYGP